MSTETAIASQTGLRGARGSELRGVGLVLLSAAAFGSLGVLAQLAYGHGVSVLGLLTGRFVVAGAMLWLIAIGLRRPLPSRRAGVAGVSLGVGYSSMALCFAASLRHLDAGLADLLLFAYPVLVSVGAVALGRERWTRRHATALAVTTAGILLAVAGGGGVLDPQAVELALAAALIYAAYVLASSSLLRRTDPLVLAALISTGAALVFCGDAAITGQPATRSGLCGAGLVVAVALSSSVLGTSAFMAGVRKLGASRASIVSSAEPALTAIFAFAALGQAFAPAQLVGAGFVLAAVPILELKSSGRKRSREREARCADSAPSHPQTRAGAARELSDTGATSSNQTPRISPTASEKAAVASRSLRALESSQRAA